MPDHIAETVTIVAWPIAILVIAWVLRPSTWTPAAGPSVLSRATMGLSRRRCGDAPRRRFACALGGHRWTRVGWFVAARTGDGLGDERSEQFPVSRCSRCRVGHPDNPEITTLATTDDGSRS